MTLSLALAPLLPTPVTPPPPAPPQAHIEASCPGQSCDTVLLESTGTTGATSYEWFVDGALMSNDTELSLAIVPNELAEVELVVYGPGGSDDTTRWLASGHGVQTPNGGVKWPLVVAGVTSCRDGFVGVSTIGGCFMTPGQVDQPVTIRDDRNNVTTSLFSFDRNNEAVLSWGKAEAAVYALTPGATENLLGNIHPTTYQAFGDHPPMAAAGEAHLTSYTPVKQGDLLTFGTVHQFVGTNQVGHTARMMVDCSTLEPIVTRVD
jgi:hypothetical protein